MASQSDILQSCLQEASRAAGPALERCIDEALTWLQAAEGMQIRGVNRDDVSNAQRELLKNKTGWAKRYPADLLVRFKTELAAAGRARSAPGSLQDRSFAPTTTDATLTLRSIDTLSLVDDAKISHQIESSRLIQNILPAVEHAVAELNLLMSTIQGLPNVRPDLNPLRPEVFTETLQEIMSAVPVEPVVTSLWLRCLAEPLGRELKKLYEGVVDLPQLANVSGASYRVLTSPSGSRRSGGSAASGSGGDKEGDGSATGFGPLSGYGTGFGDLPQEPGDSSRSGLPAAQPSQYADLSNYEIRDELFQDFLFNGGSNASHKLTPAYYATIDRELAALRDAPDSGEAPLVAEQPDYQRLPAVDRPPRFVSELTQLSQEVWGDYGRSRARAIVRTELKKEATQVGQVLGLEVVRKLVNQVAQDPRLLVPVREAIVALEPSLLRLAMVDPRFFSDEDHAGRRLMEQVAQRSFKYNDEYSAEFLAFFDPVIQAFNELNNRLIENVEPFSAALATLEYGWDQQDQLEAESRDKVMEALRFAEERQTRAEQIASDLSMRPDLDNVPGLILDFLFGPWALAMAHAQLIDTRNQMDPMGLGLVVPDLVWSVKREATLKQPGKLIQMIPGLLSRLHAGLDLLGQDRRESEPFFDNLMDLHHPVLKLRRMKSQQDAMESGAMPLEPEGLPATPEERLAKAAAHHPWLGREELDAAGFQDTMPSEPAELTAQAEEKASPPPASPVLVAPAEQAFDMDLDEAEPPSPTTKLNADEAAYLLLTLQTGCWVDLYSKRRWLRAQLIWASTKGTLFMFVSHGGQPHSMTKRSCERLLRDRFLRPVDSQGVVAQALDAVASEVASQAPASRSREPQTA